MHWDVVLLFTILTLVAHPAQSQWGDRVSGWKADIDSVVARIAQGHPNPWAHRSRGEFMAEARALRDSVPTISDGRVLLGIMRLASSIGDGHTGVVDLGTTGAAAWFPVRFALFADGLWVTAIAPELGAVAGRRVASLGGRPIEEVIGKWPTFAQGDNIFNRRQHSAMLSNGVVLNALGFIRRPDSLMFEVEGAEGQRQSVSLGATKGSGSLEWEQYGEMRGPPGFKLTTAFGIPSDAYLDPDSNSTLPLHLRGRRAYWWTYVSESRTLFFQLNSVTAHSRYSKQSLFETWSSALAFADSLSGGIDRLILDLRYNSGGDGSLIPSMMRALIKRDGTVARPGHFFVLTSGKTFSAAVAFVVELVKYEDPILVGEPAGAGLNASGDAGRVTLPYGGVGVIVSTRYTQSAPAGDTSGVIAVNVPAPMRGTDYFRRVDPALEAIWSEPVPYPTVIGVLGDSGGASARQLWEKLRSRYAEIAWWEPWRWSDLNAASYDLLEHGRSEDALTGFLINTERKPQIWETWDSLGEGYLKAGRKEDALRSYQRALQIDPRNWNASEQRRIVADLRAGKPQ